MTSDYLLISLARRRLWWGSRPRAWPVSQLQTSVLGMIAVRLAVPAAHEQRESVVKGAPPVGTEPAEDWRWERTGESMWEQCDVETVEVSSDEDEDGHVKPQLGAGHWAGAHR